MKSLKNKFEISIKENISIKESLKNKKYLRIIEKIINQVFVTIKRNKKIMTCGNGGSAADAQHLAAEFVVRLNKNKNRRA